MGMGIRSAVIAGVLTVSVPCASQAQGFFEALFGAFGGGGVRAPAAAPPRDRVIIRKSHRQPLVFDSERRERSRSRVSSGDDVAFCVRTCDGRHFPAPTAAGLSPAEVCNNFCPAAETGVYYGSAIDSARSEDGELYSRSQNAFRYRSELVAGCSCNGRDPVGLARIDINEDRTLRKGDIVASEDGLRVATGRVTRDGVALSEMPASVRASFAKVPVVAKE